jgi:hypothetical protein
MERFHGRSLVFETGHRSLVLRQVLHGSEPRLGFDNDLLDIGNLPPGTPMVNIVQRTRWAQSVCRYSARMIGIDYDESAPITCQLLISAISIPVDLTYTAR